MDLELQRVCCAGNVEEAAILLEAGANPSWKDNNDVTHLHSGALFRHLNIVQLLLENNAEIDARDMYGFTPLAYATVKRHFGIVKALLEKGANPNIPFLNEINGTETTVRDMIEEYNISDENGPLGNDFLIVRDMLEDVDVKEPEQN